MAKTRTITVTSVTPVAIAAETYSGRIIVGEDPSVANWPTTDFTVVKPATTNTARRVSAGASYQFDTPYQFGKISPGSVVGYVQTVSGTTTFFIDEE